MIEGYFSNHLAYGVKRKGLLLLYLCGVNLQLVVKDTQLYKQPPQDNGITIGKWYIKLSKRK